MKVSASKIEALLASCTLHYNKLHGTTTVCQVILPNGFNVAMGFSSCVDPKNYDARLGRQYAMEDALPKARDKLWEFEGYRLAMRDVPMSIEEDTATNLLLMEQSRV